MSDLSSLFRDEMLKNRASRLAGGVIDEHGSGTWTAIVSCLAFLGLAVAWAASANYSTGRHASGIVESARSTDAGDALKIVLPRQQAGFLHTGMPVDVSSPSTARRGRVTSVTMESGVKRLRHLVSGDHQVIVVRVFLVAMPPSKTPQPGVRVEVKGIVETRTILRWITGV